MDNHSFQLRQEKEAAEKAFETFSANTYLFAEFFGRPIRPVDKGKGSNLEAPGFADYLDYSNEPPDLADFREWLDQLFETGNFRNRCNRYIDIHKRLKNEDERETRHYLIVQARQVEETE